MTDCTDALDILIEQEQQLITRFEARQAGADGIVTAIVTSAFTVAALITTAAQTIKNIDKTLALVAVVALAVVLVVTLCPRVFAGRHFSRSGDSS